MRYVKISMESAEINRLKINASTMVVTLTGVTLMRVTLTKAEANADRYNPSFESIEI